MREGFTDDDFYREFKKCYTYLWQDLEARYNHYHHLDLRAIRQRKKPIYCVLSPSKYLASLSCHVRKKYHERFNSQRHLIEQEALALRDSLTANNNSKLAKRKGKEIASLRLRQTVLPSYFHQFEQSYFKSKRSRPEDVSTRYRVVEEVSKYKSVATISFLYKVNASERNFNIRYTAFKALQEMGEVNVKLKKNRKGKKRKGDTDRPSKICNPQVLLQAIYFSQMEQSKAYDIFISHSSLNANSVIRYKEILNSMGYHIYADWVNDKNELSRRYTSVETARVLEERLKASKAMLYIHTAESLNSKWTPWEIGYFSALEKPIYVLYEDSNVKRPPYLDICREVKIIDDKMVDIDNNMPIHL